MSDETYPKASSGKPRTLEVQAGETDGRRFSPSIARNRDVLREIFLAHMPRRGDILEIASGTGEHGIHITAAAPGLSWRFSDPDRDSRASQSAWIRAAGRAGLHGPDDIDVTDPDWPTPFEDAPVDGVISVNMIHISPFAATEGLIAGAARVLKPSGKLFLYGPFARNGEIAPSNARFSEDLKRRDPSWGVRDLDQDVLPIARAAGFALDATIDMPAHNMGIVFAR